MEEGAIRAAMAGVPGAAPDAGVDNRPQLPDLGIAGWSSPAQGLRSAPSSAGILFLTSVLGVRGGAEKNLLDVVTHLSPHRFRPHVIALQGGETLAELGRRGYEAQDYDLKRLLSRRGLRAGLRLFRFLRSRRIRILVTSHPDADILGALVGTLARVPLIVSNRRDMGYLVNARQARAYRLLNPLVHRFIAVSEAVKREVARTQSIPPWKIAVIYNGVAAQAESFRPSRGLRHLLGLPHDAPLVGMVASFRPVKGQATFVRAAALVADALPQAHFVIAGDTSGDYYPRVLALMKELRVERRVHCLGARDDIPQLLPSLDVFVLSSLHEGFSNAILEAMAAGLPVVAPDSGGNPEVVVPDAGILFPPGDHAALARAVLALLRDPAWRARVGGQARQHVLRNFSLDGMIRDYERFFLANLC